MTEIKRSSCPDYDSTREEIYSAALVYLGRYASSSNNLKNVLMRRMMRSSYKNKFDSKEMKICVDEIVSRLEKEKIINDNVYAEGRIETLFRQGKPIRVITAKLREKAVKREVIEKALTTFEAKFEETENFENLDLVAAKNFARRRKMGPFRKYPPNSDQRKKDLAKMGRAGFTCEVALRTINGE